MKTSNRCLAGVLGVVLVAVTTALAVTQESGPEFERQSRVADIVRFLGAQPGSLVADVGAGEGAFTIPIARAVAPNGRAVAVDISESALDKLRDRAGREDVKNVDIVIGGIDDPHLPIDQFDAVLIHNAYHEMTEHEAMLRHVRAALKQGGRFVIVEPMHESSRGLTRDKQVAQHDIAIEIVDEELRAAGFEVVERDAAFIKFTAVPGGFWLLVARRR
jgi:ubiquinone/menaquinone biosynthesis C-methylase UbiE